MARRSGHLRVVFKGEDKLSGVAAKVVQSLAQVSAAGGTIGKAFSPLGQGVQVFSPQATAKVTKFGNATATAGTKVEGASRSIARLNSKMGAVGRRVGFATKAMAGFFLAFEGVRAIKSAVATISEFGEVMAHLQAVARPSINELIRLEATARSLGATTKFTAKEAGEGLLFLARTGFSVGESINAVKATLDLAVIGMLDLGNAADYASNIVQQFGLRAEDTRRVVDSMTVVANNANTNIEQLAQALKFAGPLAGSLGREIEETAAAIGVLGDRGLQATIAGRGLRGVLASLLKPTAEAKKVFREVNISLKDLDPTTNSLAHIFAKLKRANLSAAEALKVFSRESVNQALILTENATRVYMLEQKQKDLAGESERVSKILNDTLGASFKHLASATSEFFLALGDKGLGSGLKSTLKTLTGAIRVLSGFEGAVKRVSLASLRLAIVVKSIFAASAVYGALRLIGILGVLAKTFVVATVAAKGLNLAMMKNPYIAVAMAIAAVVGALVAFNQKSAIAAEKLKVTRESFKGLKNAATDAADAALEYAAAIELGDIGTKYDAAKRRLKDIEEALLAVKKQQVEIGRSDFIVELNKEDLKALIPDFDFKTYAKEQVGKYRDFFNEELLRWAAGRVKAVDIDLGFSEEFFEKEAIEKFRKEFGRLREELDKVRGKKGKWEVIASIREEFDKLEQTVNQVYAIDIIPKFTAEIAEQKKVVIDVTKEYDKYKRKRDEEPAAVLKAKEALKEYLDKVRFENTLIGKTAEEIKKATVIRGLALKAAALEGKEKEKLIGLIREEIDLGNERRGQIKAEAAGEKRVASIQKIIQALDRKIALSRMDAQQASVMQEVWAAVSQVQFDNAAAAMAFTAAVYLRIKALKEAAKQKKEGEQADKDTDSRREQERRGREDIKKYIESLKFEQTLIGKTNLERVRAVAEQELLNLSIENSVKVSKELVKYVGDVAVRIDKAAAGAVNLSKAFQEALAEGGVHQAADLVFDQLNKNIKGTGDQVTVFSASMADAIENAAREGLDAMTDELLDPLVQAFKDIFGDNGVLTRILTAFFDTFLRTLMKGVFTEMFTGLGLPGFPSKAPVAPALSGVGAGGVGSVGGPPAGLGGGGLDSGTEGGGQYWWGQPAGKKGTGPIVPFVFPRGGGAPGGPIAGPKGRIIPKPIPGGGGPEGLPGASWAGFPGGGGGAEQRSLQELLARLAVTFPEAQKGPNFPDLSSFGRAVKSGMPSRQKPFVGGSPEVPKSYFTGFGGFGGGGVGGVGGADYGGGVDGGYGAPPTTSAFKMPQRGKSLNTVDYSNLKGKLSQIVPPRGAQLGVGIAGLGGAAASGIAGLAGAGSALAGVLGPAGFVLSAAAMLGAMGIESYGEGENIKQIIEEGSLKDLDRAFDSLRTKSVAGAFHPVAFGALGLPGMLSSEQFSTGEVAGASGAAAGAMAAMPFLGPVGWVLAGLGIDSLFGDAKRRARKRLIRKLRELTDNLREQVKENLSGQISPEALANLDYIFKADYLSRDQLNVIAAEGLDPFRDLQLSLLQRSPGKMAYRPSMLQPGGSAPRAIPLINQPPFAEDELSRQVNPDNLSSGLKAFQRGLVPLIDDVRVSEGIRETMDLTVPLAYIIPMRFSKQALSFHPTVYPDSKVVEGMKDSGAMFRPFTEGLVTKISRQIRVSKGIDEVGYSRSAEHAVMSAQDMMSSRYGSAPAAPTTVKVESPTLNVNAKLTGGYSVELLARDLAFHTGKSISASLGRLGG